MTSFLAQFKRTTRGCNFHNEQVARDPIQNKLSLEGIDFASFEPMNMCFLSSEHIKSADFME